MEIYSWYKVSDNSVVKTLDFSSFKYNGSVIPKELYKYFEIPNTKEKLTINLNLKKKKFESQITWTRPKSPVRRIFWGNDFSDFLKEHFSEWINLKPKTKETDFNLSFKKIDENNYDISVFYSKKELVKKELNSESTRYFIFDSGRVEGDIDFVQYTWDEKKYSRVRVGDRFIYKCPIRHSKSNQFYFYGSGQIGKISNFQKGMVKCLIENPIRFENLIYQNDLKEYEWFFKKKKQKNFEHFFNQYGMTEILYEDFQSLRSMGFDSEYNEKENKELVESHKNYYNKDFSSEDKFSIQKTRGPDQKIFSDEVKDIYSNRCCITGLKSKFLLEGSHIVQWSEDKTIRKDPRNGLCLSLIIHKCFDKGFIIIDDNYRIVVSKKIEDKILLNYLMSFDGKKIHLPKSKKDYPNKKFLKRHREKF